jgi:hypothetical protein
LRSAPVFAFFARLFAPNAQFLRGRAEKFGGLDIGIFAVLCYYDKVLK